MLEDLRTKVRSRGEAFDLFCGTNAIEGLAPAYFTKLITFFAPHLNGYILDQFTGLSINKLSAQEEQVVQMSGSWVNRKNTGAEYEAFCSRVDRLAEILNHGRPPTQHIDGYRVESLLFGKGQPWRDYIDTIYQRAEKRAETRRRAAARKKASAEA